MTSSASPHRLTVVTGASGGIGRELAMIAARRGHALLLTARTGSALDVSAATARAAGSPQVDVLATDLGTHDGVERVAARALELELPIGTLVNNAGFGAWGPFEEQELDALLGMVDLNDRAVVHLTRLLLPTIRESRGGILTVCSTASFQAGPGMAVYHASKAFALSFSLALRDEMNGTGVSVTALCPGPVPTSFADRAGVTDMGIAKLAEQSAEKVARRAWHALDRNDAIVIPGVVNKIGAIGGKLAPMTLGARIARRALGAMDTAAKR